nr:MAG TPA: hypothetical protein [Caudoviricetes sp.]
MRFIFISNFSEGWYTCPFVFLVLISQYLI